MADRNIAKGLGDFIAHEAHHAINDVRQKLFEEAWFGRVVSAEPVMEVFRERDAERSHEPSFDELWGRSHGEKPEVSPDLNAPDLER